jgi:hypothetical protein
VRPRPLLFRSFLVGTLPSTGENYEFVNVAVVAAVWMGDRQSEILPRELLHQLETLLVDLVCTLCGTSTGSGEAPWAESGSVNRVEV